MTTSWRPALAIGLACLAGGGLFEAGRLTAPAGPKQQPSGTSNDQSKSGPGDGSAPPGVITIGREAQAGIGLKVVQVRRRDMMKRLAASGRISADPARSAQLRPLGPGRVTAVLFRTGDRVSRGQTLVRYQDTSLVAIDSQLAAGRGSLEQAQSARTVAVAALHEAGRCLAG